MDEALRQIAKQALEDLRLHCRADNLTCHFYNHYSGVYWLFGTQGDIRYPCHMHGPLSHPDQVTRFRAGGVPYLADGGIEVCFFDPLPIDLSRDVLGGVSFVRREQITRSIRIRMGPEDAKGGAASDAAAANAANKQGGTAALDGVEVFIYLNYRGAKIPFQPDAILEEHWFELVTLRRMLLELARQPRLSAREAWRLRSTNLRFRGILGSLKWRPGGDLKKQRAELFEEITRCVRTLIQPFDQGRNTLCTLSVVDVNNEVKIEASSPSLSTNPEPGIVSYVARTGQLLFLSDVEEYKRMQNRSGEEVPDFLPQYVEWDPKTRCELAVPLVVQRRVVGVINLEADHAGAYDDRQVLMLFQFASTVALIIRMLGLFDDLNAALGLQQRMLAFESEREVFRSTLRSFESIGYSLPALWDKQTEEWIKLPGDSSERQPPRKGGFTRWVLDSGCAVALADLVPPKDGKPVYPTSCYVGHLAAETLDFLEWTEPAAEDAVPDGPVNPDIFRLAGPQARVITDFAFPIFSGTSEPGKREVRAVLWAKCRRFFRAVLPDEWCCLALFSKTASEALKVWRTLYDSRAPARQMVLAYHFGEHHGGEIAELLEANPHALEARLAEDVVCLNLDIRGSTGFTRLLASQRRGEEFVSFFRDFHKMTHKAVLAGQGAFDKHTGDGAQALFNVFRGEVLPGYAWPSADRVVEMQRALRCVADVFQKWNDLVRRHLPLLSIEPPHDFGLGAGLAIGAVFVGGLYAPPQVPGFEYSAHGDAMNTAAKLQGEARANLLQTLLRAAYQRNPESVLAYPRKTSLTESELEELLKRLGDRWRCVLLMDIEFETAIQETSLGFHFYRIPLEGPGKPMRILGILDS